jgi:hypothetical protein
MSGQDSFYAELAKRAEKERKAAVSTNVSTVSTGGSTDLKRGTGGDGTSLASGQADPPPTGRVDAGKRKRGGGGADDARGEQQQQLQPQQQQQQQQQQQPVPEKKRRVMTQEALDRLAQARQKGLMVRQQKAAAKKMASNARTPPPPTQQNNPPLPQSEPNEPAAEEEGGVEEREPAPKEVTKRKVAFSVPSDRDTDHVYMPADAFKTLVQGFALSGRGFGGGAAAPAASVRQSPPRQVFAPTTTPARPAPPSFEERRSRAEASRKTRLHDLCFGH